VLAVQDKARHRDNFSVREWETGGIRPLRRYVDHLAQIRRIQKYIVGRARVLGVTVVDNPSLDENLSEVLGTILHRVEDQSVAAGHQPPQVG
jgi:2-phosphoglycerate kinase